MINSEIDLWRMAAGLGLFLFGMFELEQSLRHLAGRSFKKMLRQHTERPLQGVMSGALATAALQSSSVVSLFVLALVGSEVISLASALGIVFGSNLGTTATGWLVATAGFKLDIEALALPLVALGGLGVVWTATNSKLSGFSHLVVGLGLMLMGLEFMKSGAISAASLFSPEALRACPPIVFLGAGFLLTAAIQSSSATIMITLSALYANVIALDAAAAVAIGADLGTTTTVVLGTLTGSASKKRVAAASVMFNLITDTIAFLSLPLLLVFISDGLGITDPLFSLVAFHTLFNLIGVMLFLPLIGRISLWLNRHFLSGDQTLLRHIQDTQLAAPELALDGLTRESWRLIDQAAALNQQTIGLRPGWSFYDSASDRLGVAVFDADSSKTDAYARIKQLQGEILAFALELQTQPLQEDEALRLGRIIPAIRNAAHSAKCMKDIRHDLEAFQNSVNDRFNAYYEKFHDSVAEFYELYGSSHSTQSAPLRFEQLVDLKNRNSALHLELNRNIYRDFRDGELDEVEISTLLNVNREIQSANSSLLAALADAALTHEASQDFASLPMRLSVSSIDE